MTKINEIRLIMHMKGGAQQVLSLKKNQIDFFLENPKGTSFDSVKGKKIWNKLDNDKKISEHCRSITHSMGGFAHKYEVIN